MNEADAGDAREWPWEEVRALVAEGPARVQKFQEDMIAWMPETLQRLEDEWSRIAQEWTGAERPVPLRNAPSWSDYYKMVDAVAVLSEELRTLRAELLELSPETRKRIAGIDLRVERIAGYFDDAQADPDEQ